MQVLATILFIPERSVDAVIAAMSKGVWRECCCAIIVAVCNQSAQCGFGKLRATGNYIGVYQILCWKVKNWRLGYYDSVHQSMTTISHISHLPFIPSDSPLQPAHLHSIPSHRISRPVGLQIEQLCGPRLLNPALLSRSLLIPSVRVWNGESRSDD